VRILLTVRGTRRGELITELVECRTGEDLLLGDSPL
jgi:hypothetical protein